MSFQRDSDLNDTLTAQIPSVAWHFRDSSITQAFWRSLGSRTNQVTFKPSGILRCVNPRSNSPREDLRNRIISLIIIISCRFKCCSVLRYCLQLKFTYILAYLLTPWSRVLLEKLTCFQLLQKFPAFYRTRRFMTALTRPVTCPCPEPDQSILHTSCFLKDP
jgi:hypothetical protein